MSRLPVRAKDTINQLKEEISNLSKLVEKGAGLSVGQENMVKELIRVRDDLTRKTDEQGQTIAVGIRNAVLTNHGFSQENERVPYHDLNISLTEHRFTDLRHLCGQLYCPSCTKLPVCRNLCS